VRPRDWPLARRVARVLPVGLVRAVRMVWARARFPFGLRPLADQWGDRGRPVHREYLEEFLQDVAAAIRGRCLEFQEDSYTTKFGGARVGKLDILHREPGNPNATIVADLTTSNDVPSDAFDCIICTFVLHLVLDCDRMVAELRRVLKPGGVLLVAVPDITVCYPEHGELWRFTEEGLRQLLAKHFGGGAVTVRGYGNSLTAAGWIRGLVGRDFTRSEKAHHDSRFSIMVCARAVK
jgi:SAM-dependent methyltransferase